MSSKLRPLYDRIYIRFETLLQASTAAREDRQYAATVAPLPTLDEDYRAVIRPYWRQFRTAVPKKYYFRLFSNADKGLGERVDPRYIPDDLWFDRILPYYNNLIFAKAMQDKCLANLVCPGIRRPVTVVKNIAGVFYDDELNLLTREEAAARVPGHGRVLVKPSVYSGQGRNIRFYDSDALSPQEIGEIFDLYGKNFIMQEKLAQHEGLAALNAGSLNTLRIITFLRGGRARVLSGCLRVGGPKSEVDNTSQGGWAYIVEEDGTIQKRGFTHQGGKWTYTDKLPTGESAIGFSVPGYQKAAAAVLAQAEKQAHFKIVGWDIGVAPDGEPVLIEFNVVPGCNQEIDGPTFGDETEEVLAEVLGRR